MPIQKLSSLPAPSSPTPPPTHTHTHPHTHLDCHAGDGGAATRVGDAQAQPAAGTTVVEDRHLGGGGGEGRRGGEGSSGYFEVRTPRGRRHVVPQPAVRAGSQGSTQTPPPPPTPPTHLHWLRRRALHAAVLHLDAPQSGVGHLCWRGGRGGEGGRFRAAEGCRPGGAGQPTLQVHAHPEMHASRPNLRVSLPHPPLQRPATGRRCAGCRTRGTCEGGSEWRWRALLRRRGTSAVHPSCRHISGSDTGDARWCVEHRQHPPSLTRR